MATQPLSVRKFERGRIKSDPKEFFTVATFQKAGYHIVYKPLKSYKDMQQVFKWCDENFKNKHWLFQWDCFFFTHEHDAMLFKLTWS